MICTQITRSLGGRLAERLVVLLACGWTRTCCMIELVQELPTRSFGGLIMASELIIAN